MICEICGRLLLFAVGGAEEGVEVGDAGFAFGVEGAGVVAA